MKILLTSVKVVPSENIMDPPKIEEGGSIYLNLDPEEVITIQDNGDYRTIVVLKDIARMPLEEGNVIVLQKMPSMYNVIEEVSYILQMLEITNVKGT